MGIDWGEEYRGEGAADPKKTRGERQQQLVTLLRTPSGREVIEYHFGKYTGVPEAACPPAGLMMIQTLLNHEYPGS